MGRNYNKDGITQGVSAGPVLVQEGQIWLEKGVTEAGSTISTPGYPVSVPSFPQQYIIKQIRTAPKILSCI